MIIGFHHLLALSKIEPHRWTHLFDYTSANKHTALYTSHQPTPNRSPLHKNISGSNYQSFHSSSHDCQPFRVPTFFLVSATPKSTNLSVLNMNPGNLANQTSNIALLSGSSTLKTYSCTAILFSLDIPFSSSSWSIMMSNAFSPGISRYCWIIWYQWCSMCFNFDSEGRLLR